MSIPEIIPKEKLPSTGWLFRDIIFSHGGERWIFSADEPSYEEEFVAATLEYRPAKRVRIEYRAEEP